MEKQKGANSLWYAELALEAGKEIMNRSRTLRSRPYVEKAYEIYKDRLGQKHPKTGMATFTLGKFEMARKKYRKAETYFLESLKTFENPDRPSNHFELGTHTYLVEVYERLKETEKSTRHCLAIGRSTPYGPDQEYVPLFKTPAIYPRRLLFSGIEGYVIVEFTVGTDCKVTDPKVIEAKPEHTNLNAPQ